MPDVYLLDLDGLLVDSEHLHFIAYREMCRQNGLELPWTFSQYAQRAHLGRDTIRDGLYASLPQLQVKEPNFAKLYQQKQQRVLEVMRRSEIRCTVGAEPFLHWLHTRGIAHCVVTNSTTAQVEIVRAKCPALQSISTWWTRETYTAAKPAPDAYLTALRGHGVDASKAIGFEDTPKGLRALLAAKVQGVLISEIQPQEKEDLDQMGVWSQWPSLTAWQMANAPSGA